MRQVEPVLGPPFAVPRAGQEPIDQPLVGVRPVVAEEGLDLLGRRGEAGQVEGHATDQRGRVGLGGGDEAHLLQARQDEAIDRVPDPLRSLDLRERGALGNLVRPVRALLGREGLGRCDRFRIGGGFTGRRGGP